MPEHARCIVIASLPQYERSRYEYLSNSAVIFSAFKKALKPNCNSVISPSKKINLSWLHIYSSHCRETGKAKFRQKQESSASSTILSRLA